jgi:hypothetical protein
MEVQLYAILTSALDRGVWSALSPGRFILRETAPGTHWIGGWVGPRFGLATVVNRKIPSPCRDSNPHPGRNPALYQWVNPAPLNGEYPNKIYKNTIPKRRKRKANL